MIKYFGRIIPIHTRFRAETCRSTDPEDIFSKIIVLASQEFDSYAQADTWLHQELKDTSEPLVIAVPKLGDL